MVKSRKDITPRRSLVRNASKVDLETRANVKVVVRVRPHNAKELGENYRTVINCINNQNLTFDPKEDLTPFFYHGVEQKGRDLLKKANKNINFSFDYIFKADSTNDEVFEFSTKNLIESLMCGYNCSVFAYGATGAGKTHTMLGNNTSPGITYLTMKELFLQKEQLSDERDFELAVSYLEVYNENVLDLLKPGGPPLHLREDKKLGVIVAGITLKRIANADELFSLLEKGNKCRTQHPTDANAESSRSHAVFQVYIRMSMKNTAEVRLAKLSMIDLAGSERGAATGFKGMRFTEGANINKSLLALGNCINSLASGLKHVPYRDSKLTRLLKDSLGGNCQTVMIANVSPSSMSYEDTYNTLNYATRAKKIKSHSTKNVVSGTLSAAQYIKIIDDQNKEIQRLKSLYEEKCASCSCSKPVSLPRITVSTTIKEESNNQSNTKLITLFNEVQAYMERLHRLKSNKSLLDVRLLIKDEANTRLSDFCANSLEKEKGHKKLTETISRLKKQVTAYGSEISAINNQIEEKQSEISKLVAECPDLKVESENLQLKNSNLMTQMVLEEMKNIDKMKTNELESRGNLIGKMAGLLQPWFYLLRANELLTEDMDKKYQELRTCVEGVCSVTFDEAEPPGIKDTTIFIPTKKIKIDESDSDGLNKTFDIPGQLITPSKRRNDPGMAKANPPIKSGRVNKAVKENRKPIGTMGTATRFPSIQNSASASRFKSTTKKRPAPL